MALGTYSELQTAVARWANRTNLASDLPDFIALAEGRMSVDLGTERLVSKQTVAITAGVATLPENVIEIRGLQVVGATYPDVDVTSIERIEQLRRDSYAGLTTYGAQVGNTIELFPTTTGTLSVRAKCRVPALSVSAPTNWLLTNFPSVYLYATLMEVADFLKDDAALVKWKARYDIAVALVNQVDMYRGQNARPVVWGVR